MIISLVKGGLGNMMFQIATGASLAKQNDTEFAYSYSNWHCCTQYDIKLYPLTIFSKIKKIDNINFNTVYHESGMLYQQLPTTKDLILDGYFQNEKYFDKDLVKKLFNVPRLQKYQDYTFIHIRRGDYIKYSNIHTLLSDDYYKHGLDILKPNKVIVLTDDKKWIKMNPLYNEFEISDSTSDLDDLSIMTSCKSGIIANSTFSWWGAWLSNSDSIIAPINWFSNNIEIDIIPERWIKI
jgi:hypothetical protein